MFYNCIISPNIGIVNIKITVNGEFVYIIQVKDVCIVYNKQLMTERIRELLKKKNITQGKMMADCSMGKNTLTRLVSKAADGEENENDITLQNFVKIADYLECSADYLLGRESYAKPQSENSFAADGYDDAVQEQMYDDIFPEMAAESGKNFDLPPVDASEINE